MRNTMRSHIARFGDDGFFTYHAGLTVDEAAQIDPEKIKRSALHKFKDDDEVVIRGSDIVCRIKKVLGIDVVLKWPSADWRTFDGVDVKHKGRWNLGDVNILKSHIELREWVIIPCS